MFKSLTNNLTKIFDKIRSTGTLSQAQIDESMRDIRIALLEADVALPVIKEFIDNIKNIIRFYSQKLDEINLRFSDSLSNLLKHKIILLQKFPNSRLSIHKTLQYKYLQYKQQSNNLYKQKISLFTPYDNRLNISGSNLSSLDYKKVIDRGYAIIEDENGKIISDSKLIKQGSNLRLSMRDGKVEVRKI